MQPDQHQQEQPSWLTDHLALLAKQGEITAHDGKLDPDPIRAARSIFDSVRRPTGPMQPSSFGLRRGELLAEIARLLADGWQPWEIETRFANPMSVPE